VIGVPKTIDNDIWRNGSDLWLRHCPEYCYRRRLTVFTLQLKRIIASLVLELMGREAGFITLHAGISGGADVILIS